MKKFKYLKDKDNWMLAEHFPNIDFFFAQIWLSSFVNELKNSCGKNYKKVLAVFGPKYYIHFYYGEKDSLAFEKNLIWLMKKDPKFGNSINKNIIKWSDKLREFGEKSSKIKLEKLSNKQIWKLIERQDKIHTKLYEWGWLSNATDMFHGSFTNELNSYLVKILKKLKKEDELNQIFTALTAPDKKSVVAMEEERLLKIAAMIKKGLSVEKALNKHWQSYFYLKNLWLGDNSGYTKDYFLEQARSLAEEEVSPDEKIKKFNDDIDKIKREKERLFRELKINKVYKNLFLVFGDFMLTKIYRRYAQIFWAYKTKFILQNAAERMGLNLEEIRHMLPSEIKDGLLNLKVNKDEIRKRSDFCVYYAEKGEEFISTDKNHPVLSQLKSTKHEQVSELRGQVGCLGSAKGRVRIINTQQELSKMQKGDVLVSIATNPDLVPAMKIAAAIVTEQGGVTCHAAIVSRELNIPCVIGTKIATKVLKDGDLVEVDANNGIVKIIEK
ncbi:MAG: hypothetical protein A2365_02345 [Candidatus Nealsonbacteria bacterium RIFOXYB1_FULL_40_15]|uniref:PEP-utilising enzyme mobile domain-containing protein n=2 Tax=Candidatus Nealsoniibacteriota TaxID=1817911 RepID=A0A1G2EQT6_9BACT|nr:MAG: hypothetical protein A2365_02345 [Candidatus Nealsonbacteria bacterium RIFOXYB1_FULL_40_15]OGZ27628.1 MAG: hypothetical protein A2427_02665 [Candidatus Nealsonbacteria bacterium RIFOXYC1_FULL_40_7]